MITIKKTFKIVPNSDENGGPEEPWTSLLVPRGGLDLLFGSLRVPCGPIVPPGSIYGGFWCSFLGSFGVQNLSNLVLIFDVFSGCSFEWF